MARGRPTALAANPTSGGPTRNPAYPTPVTIANPRPSKLVRAAARNNNGTTFAMPKPVNAQPAITQIGVLPSSPNPTPTAVRIPPDRVRKDDTPAHRAHDTTLPLVNVSFCFRLEIGDHHQCRGPTRAGPKRGGNSSVSAIEQFPYRDRNPASAGLDLMPRS
jgi:hypothetical protein